MDPISIAMGLAQFAPPLVKWISGSDKAADVAQKAVEVAQSVTGKGTPDDAAAAIAADPALALEYRKAVLAQQAQFEQIAFQKEQLYVQDVQDARKAGAGQGRAMFWLGVVILLTFAAVMGAVLWACFSVVQGGIKADGAVFGAVMGLVGTVVGYLAANAQQVVGYFFGSSAGSATKTDALAAAVSGFKAPK